MTLASEREKIIAEKKEMEDKRAEVGRKQYIIKKIICEEIDESFEVQPALDPKDTEGGFPPWLIVVHFLKMFNKGNLVVDITIPIKNDVCGRIKRNELTDSEWADEMQGVIDQLRKDKNV